MRTLWPVAGLMLVLGGCAQRGGALFQSGMVSDLGARPSWPDRLQQEQRLAKFLVILSSLGTGQPGDAAAQAAERGYAGALETLQAAVKGGASDNELDALGTQLTLARRAVLLSAVGGGNSDSLAVRYLREGFWLRADDADRADAARPDAESRALQHYVTARRFELDRHAAVAAFLTALAVQSGHSTTTFDVRDDLLILTTFTRLAYLGNRAHPGTDLRDLVELDRENSRRMRRILEIVLVAAGATDPALLDLVG